MLLHSVFAGNNRAQGYSVDQRITIGSPPSIVLGAIERYFDTRRNVLNLIVPLKDIGELGTLALEEKVDVAHEAHPNKAFIARYDDRLVVSLSSKNDGTHPTFDGRFTIRPLGCRTELHLKGRYTTPTCPLDDAAPGIAFDEHVVGGTIRGFLEELKAVVETEFEMLKAALA